MSSRRSLVTPTPSPPRTTLTSLPNEILLLIIKDPSWCEADLARFAGVTRTTLELTRPILFHSLYLCTFVDLRDFCDAECGPCVDSCQSDCEEDCEDSNHWEHECDLECAYPAYHQSGYGHLRVANAYATKDYKSLSAFPHLTNFVHQIFWRFEYAILDHSDNSDEFYDEVIARDGKGRILDAIRLFTSVVDICSTLSVLWIETHGDWRWNNLITSGLSWSRTMAQLNHFRWIEPGLWRDLEADDQVPDGLVQLLHSMKNLRKLELGQLSGDLTWVEGDRPSFSLQFCRVDSPETSASSFSTGLLHHSRFTLQALDIHLHDYDFLFEQSPYLTILQLWSKTGTFKAGAVERLLRKCPNLRRLQLVSEDSSFNPNPPSILNSLPSSLERLSLRRIFFTATALTIFLASPRNTLLQVLEIVGFGDSMKSRGLPRSWSSAEVDLLKAACRKRGVSIE